ncbi:MAG: VWA domain-containing protein [Deltaproteobacteria bacterium]|nr:VWA domain-containing protein [Deltaproteobacteria bacterium]
MRQRKKICILLILGLLGLTVNTLHAKPETEGDKTLSPYFFVKSDDPEVDRLPLKSTSATVHISGVIADVKVTQVYKNEGKRPLEAIYIFPASTRAAVYGMKMTIGKRTIVARIRKREVARQQYEQAKEAGKSASLLEQQRPNVFQMNVANILPSDVIRVELAYTELLVPFDAVYAFVYPTVVGPRYSDRPAAEAPPSEKWVENPYLRQGESPPYTFDIHVNLAAGLPIQDISCPSHKVNTDYDGPAIASIRLDRSEKYGGNRDYILKYRLAGKRIQTGLLLYEGEGENFFLAMVQPPKAISDLRIPPREYVFIVDVSGSMHGFPLKISKKLLKDLIGNLRPGDRFNVLLFAGGSSVMSPQSLPANNGNIRRAINLIEARQGGGGTRLLPALKRALSLPTAEGYSRSIVIATDGYVAVEAEAFDLIRNNLGNANMFTFGIGSGVNRHLIEGMARVGMGEPFVITRPEEAPHEAERFRKLIRSPLLTRIKLDYEGFQVYDVEPPGIPDVLAHRPVMVFGKWRGRPKGHLRIRGVTGERRFEQEIDVTRVRPSKANSALRYLWARHRIALLSDYNRLRRDDERIREVTSLGLSYNLLTAYTSFVAIDTRVRLKDGRAVTVKQPLPLPQGVSDLAVGKGSGPLTFSRSRYLALSPSARVPGSAMREENLDITKGECRTGAKPMADSSAKKDVEPESHETAPIQLGEVHSTEGLSEGLLESFLKSRLPSINPCYTGAVRVLDVLKKGLVFTLMIDPAGWVRRAVSNQGRNKISPLETCIIQKLKSLRFPLPKTGKGVKVTITFLLH